MKRLLIMASGRGTNAASIMDHVKLHESKAQVVGLISDRAEAPALEEARKRKVETFVIASQNEGSLLSVIERLKPDWVLLAGYKKKVSKNFLERFFDPSLGFSRVLNIHPSLLPAFPGLNAYAQAFKAGVKVSGVTVHLVDEGLDTGLPVLQQAFERFETDSIESFEARGLQLEHQLYHRAIELVLNDRIKKVVSPSGSWISTT